MALDEEKAFFLIISLFVLVVFVGTVRLASRGHVSAKYFLWLWAIFMVVALPFTNEANAVPSVIAGVAILWLGYALVFLHKKREGELDVSHDETRRVLAESNRRIDQELRTISRQLHDYVNPSLVLCKSELKRLEPYVAGDEKAARILASALAQVSDAYAQTRDVIKSTRQEVIDSIGFTAALESLVTHYTNFFDKPTIRLEHNLPKRPQMSEEVAVTAFKIIREAVFNAVKHASAKCVVVSVKFNENRDSYAVRIVDDGVGMKSKQAYGSVAGIGLIDMRERALAIGSHLELRPAGSAKSERPGTEVKFVFLGQGS